MGKCEKLKAKARNEPKSLSFRDLCYLADCHGFELARTKGSHRIYKCPAYPGIMNFQPDRNGGAKSFQVQQLLDAIDEIE